MSFNNPLVPGLPDIGINRNIGCTPASKYNIGITELEQPGVGYGSALQAAPLNIVCTGFVASGIIVASLMEGQTYITPDNISTVVFDTGSRSTVTVLMSVAICEGFKFTLGCAGGSVANLIMGTQANGRGSLQTIFNPITSISAGQFASWQVILLSGHYYWVRVG